jgi:hypothetical protein
VEGAHEDEMALQGLEEALGQDGDAVTAGFPVPHEDFAEVEVDVFDAEADAF